MSKDILVLGDIHGRFEELNKMLDTLTEDCVILVCGDFGYFPYINSIPKLSTLRVKSHKIYFCPGNHEDWDSLDKITTSPKITEIENNVFYCPFGSTLQIEQYNILFCGGAESVDWKVRTPGYDWFPQEGISYRDMSNLPCPEEFNVNVVISHTCPYFCLPYLYLPFLHDQSISDKCLEDVFQIYQPVRWYFGHFHRPVLFEYQQTVFHSLNEIPNFGYATKLEFDDATV